MQDPDLSKILMIGGKVIETIVLDDRVWINCRDEATGNICAIYVERTAEARCVSERDVVWWQGEWAMWTAKDRREGRTLGKPDVKLKRLGASGVKRPVVGGAVEAPKECLDEVKG